MQPQGLVKLNPAWLVCHCKEHLTIVHLSLRALPFMLFISSFPSIHSYASVTLLLA